MNHTPAPWATVTYATGWTYVIRPADDGNDLELCRVCQTDNAADNARLIAAAPAMADALQKALLHMLTGHKLADTDPEAAWTHIHKAENIARAAIAAARGEA